MEIQFGYDMQLEQIKTQAILQKEEIIGQREKPKKVK